MSKGHSDDAERTPVGQSETISFILQTLWTSLECSLDTVSRFSPRQEDIPVLSRRRYIKFIPGKLVTQAPVSALLYLACKWVCVWEWRCRVKTRFKFWLCRAGFYAGMYKKTLWARTDSAARFHGNRMKCSTWYRRSESRLKWHGSVFRLCLWRSGCVRDLYNRGHCFVSRTLWNVIPDLDDLDKALSNCFLLLS